MRRWISTDNRLSSALHLSHSGHWDRQCSSSGKSFAVHPESIPTLLAQAPHLRPVKAAWDSGLNPQLETTAWCLSTQTSKGKHSLAVLLVQADFSEKQAALILSVWGENRILSLAFLIHNKGCKISFLVLRMGPAYSAPSGL